MDSLNSSFSNALDETDSRITEINSSVSNVAELTAGLNESVGKAEQSIKDTNAKVDETSGAVENLNAAVEETKGKVDDLNDAVGAANKDIDTLNAMVLQSRANIKTGLIDTRVDDYGNEFPVYGIEIGQIDTANGDVVLRRFARFTSGRLSFYDQNDSEVAYISDYKLYIRNVEITISFKMGGFVDTVTKDGDVVTKWVGGEG
jgi:peptidoglycan hydrolase CwlO-like protein